MVQHQSFEYIGFFAVRRGSGVPDAQFLLADPAMINGGEISVDIGTVVEVLEERFVVNGYQGEQRYDGMFYLMHPYAFHAELSADSLRRDRMRAMQHGTYALNGQIVMLTPSATPDRWGLIESTAKLIGVRILPPDNIQVPTPNSPFRRAFLQRALEESGVDLDRFR